MGKRKLKPCIGKCKSISECEERHRINMGKRKVCLTEEQIKGTIYNILGSFLYDLVSQTQAVNEIYDLFKELPSPTKEKRRVVR